MAINAALSSFTFGGNTVADCGTASISIQRPSLELTSIGDSAQRFLAGVGGATANLEVFMDLSDAAQAALIANVNSGSVAAAAEIICDTVTVSGDAFCTGFEITAQAGNIVRANVSLQFTSASGPAVNPTTIT